MTILFRLSRCHGKPSRRSSYRHFLALLAPGLFAMLLLAHLAIDPKLFTPLSPVITSLRKSAGNPVVLIFVTFFIFGGYLAFAWGVGCRLYQAKRKLVYGVFSATAVVTVGLPQLHHWRNTYTEPEALIPAALAILGVFSAIGWSGTHLLLKALKK